MKPLYVRCPHCEFPAVVSGFDQWLGRRCRQCGQAYVPGAIAEELQTGAKKAEHARLQRTRRVVKRSIVQPRSTSGIEAS